MRSDRPEIGSPCFHQGRGGEVRAIYSGPGGLSVVGCYLDGSGERFIAAWSACIAVSAAA